MKVVFLDFDGVLNTYETLKSNNPPADLRVGSVNWCVAQLDREMIRRLNEIIQATQAKVVLSTSWRNAHPQNKLITVLRRAGFRGFVVGCTPIAPPSEDPDYSPRTMEIRMWLRATGVQEYVVLDDTPIGDELSKHHVRTRLGVGLTDQDVQKAIALLTSTSLKKA